MRGPGVFGQVQLHWNITPAHVSQFQAVSGTVTMVDRQSAATIVLTVLLDSMKTCASCSLVCWNGAFKCSFLLLVLMSNQALDDDTPEERSEYLLTVTSATPGLEVSPTARQAKIAMAASDNPYGQFSFSQHQVRVFEEQHTVRCYQVLRLCRG